MRCRQPKLRGAAVPEKSRLEAAIDGYVSAARKEELAIEAAMMRIAKSDGAIARGSDAIERFEALSQLARELEIQLANNLSKVMQQ